MKLWSCLEELPGLRAVPAMWRGGLGDEFNLVRAAFLRTTGTTVASFPCPHECGCTHSVVVRDDHSIVGVCRCESWNCDDIPLTREEIGVLEVLNKAGGQPFQEEDRVLLESIAEEIAFAIHGAKLSDAKRALTAESTRSNETAGT